MSIAAASGADKREPRFTPPKASELPGNQKVSGVTIGARAFVSEEEAKQVFGKVNPYRYRVLPVLLVIENESGKAIRLENMKVELQTSQGSVRSVPADEVPYLRGPERPQVKVHPIPRISGPRKNPLAAPEIQERAFVAKMLPPGDSASGFVYFDAELRGKGVILVSGLSEAATGQELFYFEIPLQASH
jgi:hypothetical protein